MKNNISFKILTFKLLFFILICGYSQEFLTGLQVNPVIQQKLKNTKYNLSKSLKSDTLTLPFVDDFAGYSIYPDTNLWLEKDVFVNETYCVNPPTRGVATFDALDSYGEIYSNASSISFLADYLTSKPIDLSSFSPSDSVFLCFYYQAGGYGDSPESTDKLLLEFNTPDSAWHTSWEIEGTYKQDTFTKVMIPILDSAYFVKGFQFGFSNYASLTGSFEASWAGNVDHWNIDYIMLNSGLSQNTEFIDEVTILETHQSLLKDYESIPWKHFINITSSDIYNTIGMDIYNYRDIFKNVSFHYKVNDLLTGEEIFESQISDNVQAKSMYSSQLPPTFFEDFEFSSENNDSAFFEFKYHLTSDDQHEYLQWNDTSLFYQNFGDYYSYDDGTSENGYGISGEGTKNAMLAYQFTCLKADTLRAVRMFFNKTLNDASRKYFYLTIWSHKNGEPDTILFKQIGTRPEYEDGLNQFHTYYLDTVLAISDTFYVGWIQTTTDLLNVGFDHNRLRQTSNDSIYSNPKIFYNISGDWMHSAFQGALMIRPVLSEKAIKQKPTTTNINSNYLTVYPVPAKNEIFIKYKGSLIDEEIRVSVYNYMGQQMFDGYLSNGRISTSNYNEGVYFIRLNNSIQSENQKKFIIIR